MKIFRGENNFVRDACHHHPTASIGITLKYQLCLTEIDNILLKCHSFCRNKRVQNQVKVCGYNEPNPFGPKGGSWDQIMLPGAVRRHLGPSKGPFWAKTGPFGAPGVP